MPAEPDAAALRAALAATWPPAETRRVGPWLLRRDGGGGRRVSAATLEARAAVADIDAAATGMREWGQPALFQVWPEDGRLRAALEARGAARHDETALLAAPVAALAAAPWDGSVVVGDAPIALMREIWAEGGIGPGRVAVMTRAPQPRGFLLGRLGDRPVACAFVACAPGGAGGRLAMLHGLEVTAGARRRGVATALMRAAAAWAGVQGAGWLGLAVVAANAPARATYAGLGFREVATYGYHTLPEA